MIVEHFKIPSREEFLRMSTLDLYDLEISVRCELERLYTMFTKLATFSMDVDEFNTDFEECPEEESFYESIEQIKKMHRKGLKMNYKFNINEPEMLDKLREEMEEYLHWFVLAYKTILFFEYKEKESIDQLFVILIFSLNCNYSKEDLEYFMKKYHTFIGQDTFESLIGYFNEVDDKRAQRRFHEALFIWSSFE